MLATGGRDKVNVNVGSHTGALAHVAHKGFAANSDVIYAEYGIFGCRALLDSALNGFTKTRH